MEIEKMQPAKCKVYVALFCYGGNGGLAMMAPELGLWLAKTYHEMKLDERIDGVAVKIYSDTPITMTRNRAVRDAKAMGFDMVLMLDSDNEPDGYLRPDTSATPFWKTAFDFSYDRLVRGTPTVIAAPYCGPPPEPIHNQTVVRQGDITYTDISGGEVPYLFQWANRESDNPHTNVKIDLLTRNEAARLSGIYPVAALPTGVCLFTLNSFDGLPQPYFKYEMNTDGSEKMSTEDVVATRDISIYWKITKGVDVLFATCDSWALHHKTKKVGRPQYVPIESVAEEFAKAIRRNQSANEAMEYVNYEGDPATPKPAVTPQYMPRNIAPIPKGGERLGHDVDFVTISDEDMRIAAALVEQESLERPEAEPIAGDQYQQPESEHRTQAADSEPNAKPPEAVHDSSSDRLSRDVSEDRRSDADQAHAHIDPDYSKSNGHQLTYKTIYGKKVAVLDGFDISEANLEGIALLASWVVTKRGVAPIEAAVIHSGTGQSAAAILDSLPLGSHLHALDSTIPYQFSKGPAEQFNKTFAREIESGLVMANNLDRKMPGEGENQSLDFVFIEQFLNENKLRRWYKAVAPGGVLAGLGYENPKVAKVVREFVNSYGFTMQESGDIWAIKVGVYADADTAE